METVTATDADGDSVVFTVSGSGLGKDSAVVIRSERQLDIRAMSSYTATITASDGTNTTTQVITVNVTNVNDNAPTFTLSAALSAADN